VIDRRVSEYDAWEPVADPTYGPAVIISRQVDVPVTVIEEQRVRTRLGYGGLMIANALAIETGRSFDEVVAMRQSGLSWGQIAQQNNVKLGPIVSRMDRADGEFRTYRNSKRDAKKAAKFVNGHDARDGRLDKVKPVKIRGNDNRAVKFKPAKGGGKAFARGGGGGRGKGKK
jgi:hypothetical protein